MMNGRSTGAKIGKLTHAFSADGFHVSKRIFTSSGKIGLLAEHKTAHNQDTGAPKKSYYLEGAPYERGYLLGMLAEPEISDMAIHFVDNILFDFIGLEFLNSIPLLQKMLAILLYELSEKTWKAQPQHIHDEVRGMLDGCKKSNPNKAPAFAKTQAGALLCDFLAAVRQKAPDEPFCIGQFFPADNLSLGRAANLADPRHFPSSMYVPVVRAMAVRFFFHEISSSVLLIL